MAIVPIQKIFAYNTGSLISGTTQVGDIAVSDASVQYSDDYGGLQWWGGPDETYGYVIAHTDPSGSHNGEPSNTPAYLGFWRSSGLTDNAFLNLCNSIPPRIGDTPFTNTTDASIWLYDNGYWTSYSASGAPSNDFVYITIPNGDLKSEVIVNFPPFPNPTPTPTASPVTITPTPTITPTASPVVTTPTPTPTTTPTETLISATTTPTETPTNTPTPTSTSIPVTGYSFNLVQLPYNFPSSGNTIMTNQAISGSGTTNPNLMTIQGNGIYFNSLDVNGIDRASYFSSFIGQSITITMSQTGSAAIYSGSSTAFQSWVNSGSTGYVFGYGIAQSGFTSGTTVLIQSATTNWVTGQTVTISAVVNGVGVTPTPTATSVTPTPTPTSGASGNFNITVSQQGPDVVWNGSGSFNLAALSSIGGGSITGGYAANQAIWAIGPNASIDQYSGVTTYPASFGTGGAGVTSNTGSTFGILPTGGGRLLYVPAGYTSNTTISGSSTYANNTISGMGLTPGTYTWSWGTGGNTSTLVMTITS